MKRSTASIVVAAKMPSSPSSPQIITRRSSCDSQVEAARRHATAAGLLESIVEGMQIKVSALLLENEESQEAALTAEVHIDDLKSFVAQRQFRIKELKKSKEALEKELEEAMATVTTRGTELQLLTKEYAALQNVLETEKTSATTAQAQLEEMLAAAESSRNEEVEKMKKQEQERRLLQTRLAAVEEEMRGREEEVVRGEEERRRLQERIAEMEEATQALQERLTTTTARLSHVEAEALCLQEKLTSALIARQDTSIRILSLEEEAAATAVMAATAAAETIRRQEGEVQSLETANKKGGNRHAPLAEANSLIQRLEASLKSKMETETAQTQQITAVTGIAKALEAQLNEEIAFRVMLEDRYRELFGRVSSLKHVAPISSSLTTLSSSSLSLLPSSSSLARIPPPPMAPSSCPRP